MTPRRSILAVWLRYFAVFRKNIAYAALTTFTEPILYLVSFGFGLGGMIGSVHVNGAAVSYRAFVLAGIVGQTVLFQSFFEAAYGSFIRMYYQRIFQAIAVTQVTLSEVLWGELLWDASRSTLSALAVLAVGVLIGDFTPAGALVLIPCCFCFSLLFASVGLLVAARSRTIETISYPQYLFIFPMFLFCGVFFPMSNLPPVIQKIVQFLPLTPVLSIARWLLLGFRPSIKDAVILIAWCAVLIPWSRHAMRKRLVA